MLVCCETRTSPDSKGWFVEEGFSELSFFEILIGLSFLRLDNKDVSSSFDFSELDMEFSNF